MFNYMFIPPVVDSTIPFLTSLEYGNLLSTCKELNTNFDRNMEWKRRSPDVIMHHKTHALIKDTVKRMGALHVLNEVTNKQNLNILIYSLRRMLPITKLLDIYYSYLNSDDCLYYFPIRLERIRLGTTLGMKLKTRKKRKMTLDSQNCTHKLRKQLRLGI